MSKYGECIHEDVVQKADPTKQGLKPILFHRES